MVLPYSKLERTCHTCERHWPRFASMLCECLKKF
uniref:Uncharacterized protein n=1 Tax=Arundo donax TaxID=35708 RepID=A0A0A9GII1_ARUDO